MDDEIRNQRRLLLLAATFLGLYALILTLSPAVRARNWDVEYRFEYWAGFGVWLIGFWLVNGQMEKRLPQRDPYLLPIMALLSGWGLLTIWRLTPTFGLRQTAWLAIALIIFTSGFRLRPDLNFLRRYKYIWLTGGLLLTMLTLVFGTNPMGFGPRLWLGCCGIYLQPSEPLKLLLVVYLAAYFADWQGAISSGPSNIKQMNVLTPTFIMTGLALLLILVQRDLGTASIFIFLYSVMIFLATGWHWVPLVSAGTLAAASLLGYLVFDVIRLRMDAWLNPWLDPAGRSYQIVQALISVANGGIWGRGPGLGSPALVPVAHSDFVFTAIAEETGLVGTIGFLMLLALLIHRGMRLATLSTDPFRRLLAAGLTAFLAAQSILIVGGNLRLLPLTGVTLPFVSYGGSSLVVSFVIGLIFLLISSSSGEPSIQPVSPSALAPINILSTFLFSGLFAIGLISGWWGYLRGPDLLTRTDNPRRSIADRLVPRGAIYDRQGNPLAETVGTSGALERRVNYPDLAPVIGYNNPVYGQTGLEASLDTYLRGTEGHDPFSIWWHRLLYGQSPPGLDVRLTLDLDLQQTADALLNGHTGALILMNAENGEILVMASHPTYDPNQLDENWDLLIEDPAAPLLNRVTQGVYPTGLLADRLLTESVASLETSPVSIRLPLAEIAFPHESSPFETILVAAALSTMGTSPAPQIAQMVSNPDGGWLLLPKLNKPIDIMPAADTLTIVQDFAASDGRTWQIVLTPEGEDLTWFVGGALPGSNYPLAVVVVLEEANVELARMIGQEILKAAGIQ